MKLHLPKMLFTAVIAAACCVQVNAATEGVEETYTVTSNNDSKIVEYTAEDTITFNLSSGYLYMPTSKSATIAAKVVIENLKLTDGSGSTTYTFSNAVSGTGEFSFTATSTCKDQKYIFEGNMSEYSGNMYLITDDRASSFVFNENESGTGEIKVTGTNKVEVNGATMNNSSITASNLTITGTSTFSGNVTASTLTFGENVAATFGAGTVLTMTDSYSISSGTLTFADAEEGKAAASIVIGDNVSFKGTGNVEHGTFGYLTNKALDILGGTATANREVSVTYAGQTYTMTTDGVLTGSEDNSYHISGDVSVSDIMNSGDDLTAVPGYTLRSGTLTMDQDFTLTGNSSLTGTTVEGTGKLIVAENALLQVNSTAQNIKSNLQIAANATLEFLGTGEDAINYSQTDRTIYVEGIMDVGTTRQTVGNWTFELTGGTIRGNGQESRDNVGLDFHSGTNPGTINTKAAANATADNPTVSTISTNVRNNGKLVINTEANTRLDITGKLIHNAALEKNGSGILRLANNDNTYSNNTITVNGGLLEIRDNGLTIGGAVTVNKDATLTLLQTNNSAKTLSNVTLNGGSLLTQGSDGAYTTTLTNLNVGTGGATIGTQHDTSYANNSWQSTIAISALTGTGDLILTSASNTSNATVFQINGGSGYSGTVKVQNNTKANGRKTHLDIGFNTALASSVIELGGGDNDHTGITTALNLNAESVTVKGIKDADNRLSTGNVDKKSTLQGTSTLTIATGADSYSTKSAVTSNINLVKQGTGKQIFGGDMSNFNGTVEANGGTLAFTMEGNSVTVASLNMTGGSLEVAGTLTLNDFVVDFSKYSTDTLTHTLVSAGTLQLGDAVDLNAMTGSVNGYNASVAQNGGNIVLTFAQPGPLVATDALLEDGKLTLTVDRDLTGLGSVNLTLSDAVLETIDGKYGEVGITLAGLNGSEIIGNGVDNIMFYGKYVGEGNGMYRIEYIPEPTTATLSLLALAGLAARRRRK